MVTSGFRVLVLVCLVWGAGLSEAAAQGCSPKRAIPWKGYRVPQGGMLPGIEPGTTVWATHGVWAKPAEVKRGEVVVHHGAGDEKDYVFVWRVIGLPGERLTLRGTEILIDGKPLPRKPARGPKELQRYREVAGALSWLVQWQTDPDEDLLRKVDVTVPEGSFFLMGDNRDDAADSRMRGVVPFARFCARVNP